LDNSECLRIFDKSFELFVKKQLDELDKIIKADENYAISKDLSGSGAMINGIKNR
jgi:hypothetical protein